MTKPGPRASRPSEDFDRFTDREEHQQEYLQLLDSATEPPVLGFHGVGGAGKTWLLRCLKERTRVPYAHLDFDRERSGAKYLSDTTLVLRDIRSQIDCPAPRFDLAFAMMRCKQTGADEPKVYGETLENVFSVAAALLAPKLVIPAAIVGTAKASPIPAGSSLLSLLSKPLRNKIKGTSIEEFLAKSSGRELVIHLRSRNAQEIENALLGYLTKDLQESLPINLHRAVRAVVFLDTFEDLSDSERSSYDRERNEEWVRRLASAFDFALIVILGRNRLRWEEIDPAWEQHSLEYLLGGLSELDARLYLQRGEIADLALQSAILSTAREGEGSYHCLTLGMCLDIVSNEREAGLTTGADSLAIPSGDWATLARRFLRSLCSDSERFWIHRLAVTPRFDEAAAKAAHTEHAGVTRDTAWMRLKNYSFVDPVAGARGWYSIRPQIRAALSNQPDAPDVNGSNHVWWHRYWHQVSMSATDSAASLAWYHRYSTSPGDAIVEWQELAESAREAKPARMGEHFSLLGWMTSLNLIEQRPNPMTVFALTSYAYELQSASLGTRDLNLRRAIACYEAALRVLTEQDFPRDWAMTQNNLGNTWRNVPSGDRGESLRRAIACYEAALRVLTEQDFPHYWAMTQNNLGNAWSEVPSGNRGENLRRAIACYEAALRVRTEENFPRDWATTQNNVAVAWSNIPSGNRGENLRRAIACYEAALRVLTEQNFPQDWAMTQNNLGNAWSDVPSGNRGESLRRAIACYEAALRVRTERDFPHDWAITQNNLGNAWSGVPSGDRGESLHRAIACYEAALRVLTEQDFPHDWAITQNSLGNAWRDVPSGDRGENLRRAIACYEAALRVLTEQDFPQDWAMTQNNLGITWRNVPSADGRENLRRAIAYYEAALRVRTEQDFPHYWALTQYNLGNAWRDVPSGDRGENLCRAIACYEAALRVLTEQDFPHDWAITQNNLGIAWSDVPSGNRDENLRRAIACYEAALRVRTEQDFPRDWAMTQNNLGIAWSDVSSGDRGENLRRAIACYEAALRVLTEQDFPQDWAMTQYNLGNAWSDVPSGNRDENLLRAIACYEAALRVLTEQNFPRDWAMTQNNLGIAWSDVSSGDRGESLRRAIACYEAALRVLTEQNFPRENQVVSESAMWVRRALENPDSA